MAIVERLIRADAATLGSAGAQRLGEQTPILKVPRVQMLQQASKIGRLVAIEITIEFRIVSVSSVGVAPERTERDQRVEEVARAAFVNADPARESRKIERTLRQHREYAELHRTEQCFRSPERVSDLKNPFWRLVLPRAVRCRWNFCALLFRRAQHCRLVRRCHERQSILMFAS